MGDEDDLFFDPPQGPKTSEVFAQLKDTKSFSEVLKHLYNEPPFPQPLPPVGSYQAAMSIPKLTPAQKELLFGLNYGMGPGKIQQLVEEKMTVAEYSQLDAQVMQALVAKFGNIKPKDVGYLFLGGPLHGKRIKYDGHWLYTHQVPVKPGMHGIWGPADADTAPTIGYTTVNYVQQKVKLPNGHVALVYVQEQAAHNIGQGVTDQLLGSWLEQLLSWQANEVNMPKEMVTQVFKPIPDPPKPEPLSDGLRITVGGKTIEWLPDENQLMGLLQWAAQSLGPGKEAAK